MTQTQSRLFECDHRSLDAGPPDCRSKDGKRINPDHCSLCCDCPDLTKGLNTYKVWHKDDEDFSAEYTAATAQQARNMGYKGMRSAGYRVDFTDVRTRRLFRGVKMTKTEQAQRIVDQFNRTTPPGSVIIYREVVDLTKPHFYQTRGEAFVADSGAHPVVFLEGKSGYVLISEGHIEPATEEQSQRFLSAMRNLELELPQLQHQIKKERERQIRLWLDEMLPKEKYISVAVEELGEVVQAMDRGDMKHARKEAIEVAAVMVRFVQAIDRGLV